MSVDWLVSWLSVHLTLVLYGVKYNSYWPLSQHVLEWISIDHLTLRVAPP